MKSLKSITLLIQIPKFCDNQWQKLLRLVDTKVHENIASLNNFCRWLSQNLWIWVRRVMLFKLFIAWRSIWLKPGGWPAQSLPKSSFPPDSMLRHACRNYVRQCWPGITKQACNQHWIKGQGLQVSLSLILSS